MTDLNSKSSDGMNCYASKIQACFANSENNCKKLIIFTDHLTFKLHRNQTMIYITKFKKHARFFAFKNIYQLCHFAISLIRAGVAVQGPLVIGITELCCIFHTYQF